MTQPPASATRKFTLLYAVTFLFLTALVVAFISHDLSSQYRDTLDYWDSQLSNAADDQVKFSTLWLNERHVDTLAVSESSGTISLLTALKNKNRNVKKLLEGEKQGIAHIASVNGFVGGALGDDNCEIVVQTGLQAELLAGIQDACRFALRTAHYRVSTFVTGRDRVWLSLAAPVRIGGRPSPSGAGSSQIGGAVVMVTNSWEKITPFFGSTNIPKGIRETYLIWSEDQNTVIFSPRLAEHGVGSLFRRPANADLFETRAAQAGNIPFGEFVNFHGQAVFGIARGLGIPGRVLAREVLRDQALSEYYRHRTLEWLVGTLSLLLFGTVIAALHRRAKIRELEESNRQREELQKSEQRYKNFISNSKDGVWRVELNPPIPLDLPEEEIFIRFMRDSYFAECNLAMARIYGCATEHELLGKSLASLITKPDSDPERIESFHSAIRGGFQSRNVEFRGRDKAGNLRDLLRTEVPIVENGLLMRVWGISRDVTDLKRAEEGRRKSDARWRAVFERSAAGIALSDPVTARFLAVNIALQKMLGYSEEELRELTFIELTHPDDRETNRQLLAKLMDGEQPLFEMEKRYRRKDGTFVWANILVSTVPGTEGDSHIAMAIIEDISRRKQVEEALRASETRFRTLMERAPVAISISRMGKTLYVNQRYLEMYGLRSVEEVIGHSVGEQWTPEFRSIIEDRVRKRAIGLPVAEQYEGPGLGKDGRRFPVEIVVAPVVLPDGEASIGFLTDITERKRAQEERQRSLDQLRALAARLQNAREEERKRVAREIHDQLGQVLTAIKIDLKFLLRELPESQIQASSRADSIMKLVDESIHSVRRISTELRPGILDDLGLVSTLEWAGEDFQARTGTVCRLDLPDQDISVDTERATAIFRIFQETLTNVARHAQASEVEVKLTKVNGDLELRVHDNGKGFVADKLAGGQSLGILGMRERATLLGGEITIQSLPGSGTTVSVRIPTALDAPGVLP